MKRSETNTGDAVVVGTYGRRAEIADNGAWTRATSYRGFRVSDAEYAEHLAATDGDRKAIGPKYACIAEDRNGVRKASFKRATGSTILVRYTTRHDAAQLDVTTLSAVHPLAEYENEQRQERERRAQTERAYTARRDRVAQLPAELHANVSQYGVTVSLDALEKVVAAAQTLDDLIGGGFVDEETVAAVQEAAAQSQLDADVAAAEARVEFGSEAR